MVYWFGCEGMINAKFDQKHDDVDEKQKNQLFRRRKRKLY